MTDYTIAFMGSRWFVLDIRGGSVSVVVCETPTEGKAKLIATLLNNDSDRQDYRRAKYDRTTPSAANGGSEGAAEASAQDTEAAENEQA